jgi:Kef-type K+ transport system membrane component KefB
MFVALVPLAALILSLAVVMVVARLGGRLAVALRQPPVLGELLAGVAIGNLALVGFPGLEYLKTDAAVDALARIGVILLLFQVGLEATIPEMLKVGLSALLVAILGVVGPFGLGWIVAAWLLPDAGAYAHVFLGAMLTATSVGVTARVLKDLGRSQTDEARIILGAAVVDDVLGLVVLAAVTGIISAASEGRTISYVAIALVLLKPVIFLFGSVALGVYVSPRLFSIASKLQANHVLLGVGLLWCFVFAWMANAIGLAPIVGAFAAGLILEDLHYRPFTDRGGRTLDELIHPFASLLAPVFFVLMGIRTTLSVFGRPRVLGLAAALAAAAIVGKQLCALGVVKKGLNRMSIGIGMIPRGEVDLIFASIGLTLTVAGRAVVDESLFSAVVVTVIVTTVITPPALKWSFERR